MITVIEWLARAVVGAAVVVFLWLAVGAVADNQPHCPTEDSCTVDYRNGAWHIEETTP